MPEKKVVDDYYSSIPKTQTASGSDGVQKKAKIKPKKKVVVKKKEVVTEVKKEEKIIEKKPISKSKKVIQKLDVVERKPVTIKKRENIQDTAKKEENFKVRGSDKTEKKKFFGNDKPKSTSNNFEAKGDHSKAKKLFGHKKTRGRVKTVEEDATFTRSNKIAKIKKEEKKVEDIKQNLVDRKGQTIMISDVLTLKEFSDKLGVALARLIAEFMKNGLMVNINSKVDFETASIIADAFEIKVERDKAAGVNMEDIVAGDLTELLAEDDSSKLQERCPVISIMGHVDHGKTSLLDHIRKSRVTAGEAGGITQSIGAYQVEHGKGKITFLDTPGHEAFTVMRARGAKSTDIAILVVAADEGVKPQTIESINHAKEAAIPVIVAINKMDKEGANPDHVKGQLSEHGLTPEDWGGDTPMVPVSAMTGFGIDDLLEIILLVAEMQELKANPDRKGVATVVESHLDQKLGPVATVLVNTGTIAKGDNIVCQDSFGKIKILKDHTSTNVKFALPGQPVLIVGLDKVVEGGDILQVVASSEVARQKADDYREVLLKEKRAGESSLDLLMSKIKAGNLKQLKIVLKADTNGALEAMKGSLIKLSTPETSVSIIHSGVGNITEGDILMCQGSDAILIGFSVPLLSTAKSLLESAGIEYINSDIIYHITERVEKIVTGMLDPKEVEVTLGKAKVGGIFYTSKKFLIVGLKVPEESKIENNALVRVIRNKKMVGSGKIESLKQGTLEVKEIEGPTECGIQLAGVQGVEEGDELEIYKIEIQK